MKTELLAITVESKTSAPKPIDKNYHITAIMDKLNPVFANGAECKTSEAYMQQVLTCKTPLIYVQKSADIFPFLQALMKYIDSHFKYSRQRFLYVDHPLQLSNQLEAVCIENSESKLVSGLLSILLDDEIPSILVINFSEFSPLDLIEVQGIGDKNRTLKNYSSLKKFLNFIGLIESQAFSKQDSFLSRLVPFVNRVDLFPKTEDMAYGTAAKLDETSSTVIEQHLYNNSTQAETALIGGAQLIDGELKYINGVFPTAMSAEQSPCLTDIPTSSLNLLRNISLTQQILVNGRLKRLPAGFQWSHRKRLTPSSDYVQFMEIPTGKRPFYLNPETYNLLVTGDAIIDSSGHLHSRSARLLSEEDRPDIIILTQSLSYSCWCRLVDEINHTKKITSIWLASGVKIEDTKYCNQAVAHSTPVDIIEEKSLKSNLVIETNDLESAIKWIMANLKLTPAELLTLTPQINLELLMQTERQQGFNFSYTDGWLLARLRKKTITVIAGFMSATLYYRLESLFTSDAYLYTNEGRENFPGIVIWIKPKADPISLSSVVKKCQFEASMSHTESKSLTPAPLKTNILSLVSFLTTFTPSIYELIGPVGCGKSLSIQQAKAMVKKQGYAVHEFFSIESYVEWLKQEKIKVFKESKIIPLLQLEDATMFPAGTLEGLRDITRRQEFFWNGEWYPAPKVIFTNSPETKALRVQHGILSDPRWPIPQLIYAPVDEKTLSTQVLESLLCSSGFDHYQKLAVLILNAYRYISEFYPSISMHELTRACRRVQVLCYLKKAAELKSILIIGARAAYEEFFGLLSQQSQRVVFWEYLVKEARRLEPSLKETTLGDPISPHIYLKNKLRETDLKMTAQHNVLAEMIWRQLQIRDSSKDISARCGLLLEGPPAILKTELILAVLKEYGCRAYINLNTGDPHILIKQAQQAYTKRWVIVCNEINLLPLAVQSTLSKMVDAGLSLLATQNATQEGGGRKPLLPRLKNRLQIIQMWDYSLQDWQNFAENAGFKFQESGLLAAMFVQLKEYQHQYQLPLANARHYFRLLKDLHQQSLSPNLILQHLFKDCCNPVLDAEKASKPGQQDAAYFILQRVNELLLTVIEEKPVSTRRPDIFFESHQNTKRDDDYLTPNYCLIS